MDHFMSGQPVIAEEPASTPEAPVAVHKDGDGEIVGQIAELLETRIRPVAQDQGGDIIFHGFDEGRVSLEFQGGAFALQDGIQTMLRHYIPEVTEVVNHLDTIPKPGLDTPEGQAIKRVLDEEINPQVAMHGGHIALVDLIDDTVYIRLEGGCQGCGMAEPDAETGCRGRDQTGRAFRRKCTGHDRSRRRFEPVLSARQGRNEPVLEPLKQARLATPDGSRRRGGGIR